MWLWLPPVVSKLYKTSLYDHLLIDNILKMKAQSHSSPNQSQTHFKQLLQTFWLTSKDHLRISIHFVFLTYFWICFPHLLVTSAGHSQDLVSMYQRTNNIPENFHLFSKALHLNVSALYINQYNHIRKRGRKGLIMVIQPYELFAMSPAPPAGAKKKKKNYKFLESTLQFDGRLPCPLSLQSKSMSKTHILVDVWGAGVCQSNKLCTLI